MSILSTEQLGHFFNDRWLFRNVYLGLGKGNRVALVGINGSGKTTLLKILSGVLSPLEGKVVTQRDLRIGYLEQDPKFRDEATVSDFVYSADNVLQQLIRKYEEAVQLENSEPAYLNHLMNELSNQDAWEYEFKIKNILGRLGIVCTDQKVGTLSGGQRKRLALAKLLIDDLDVYILDEPTNHLDIDTIEWLENFLTTGQKTVLLVTHDRYFLDKVSNQIIELDQESLFTYNGSYSYYLEKKAELLAATEAAFKKNNNLLRRELEWMRRQPKARATKSKSRIDAFYDLEKKAKSNPSKDLLELNIHMSRQGNKILEIEQLSKNFGQAVVLSNFNYIFKKGDRIGVVGKNGTGKTTLINLITGQLLPDKGKITVGETTVFGYYQQGGLLFKGDERVLDVVKNVAEYIQMADGKMLSASQLLTHFLFPPAKQYGLVDKLSGGEKKRLQLMRVLIKNPNFLILDEPTNDLDIDTLNVLEDFLLNFSGVLMLVSHDRYLVDRLTNQLFVFEGQEQVRVYSGNYTDYRLEQEELLATSKIVNKSLPPIESEAKVKVKLSFKEEKEFEYLENEIQLLEKNIADLTDQLSTGISEYDQLMTLTKQIELLTNQLDEKSQRWLHLSELKK